MAPIFNQLLSTNTSTLLFITGFVITIFLIILICCTNPPNPRHNGVYVIKSSNDIKHHQYRQYKKKHHTQPIKTVSLNVTCPNSTRDGRHNNILANGLSTTLPVPKSAKLDAIIQFNRHQQFDTEYNKSGVKVISCNRSFL